MIKYSIKPVFFSSYNHEKIFLLAVINTPTSSIGLLKLEQYNGTQSL